MPFPSYQYGPFGPPDGSSRPTGGEPPHLTMTELAERWRRTRKTVEKNYKKWGLRPLRFGGGKLLFPMREVLAAEVRAMRDPAREDSHQTFGDDCA